MKRFILAILVIAVTSSVAWAVPTVTLSRTPGTYPTFPASSGEWTLTPNAELGAILGGMSSFQSFCVEEFEKVVSGTTYRVVINDEAIYGDGRWSGEPAGPDGGDMLDSRTAYLYSEFRKGTLPTYDYTPGSGRQASALALQSAIWHLEQETSYQDYNLLSPEAKYYVDLAITNNPGTIGNVRVLNLWDLDPESKTPHQDMLALVIPAPGAILLGSIGIGLVGWLRRRRSL